MQTSRNIGILLAFACLLILGIMPLLSNARPQGSDGLSFAIWLTFWQLAAALPLFLFEHFTRKKLPSTMNRQNATLNTGVIALISGCLFGLATYIYVVAAEKAGAVNFIVALQAYPLTALLAEAVFLGRRKSLLEVAFTCLTVMALVYLLTGGTFALKEASPWTALALLVPVLWTIAHLLLRQVLLAAQATPSQVTVSRLVISGLFLLALHALTGEDGALLLGFENRAFVLAAVSLGFAYYAELLLWFYAMRHIDVSLGSSITVPAPAVTMLVSAMLLKQPVQTYQVITMLVASAGIYGLLLAGKKRENAEGRKS